METGYIWWGLAVIYGLIKDVLAWAVVDCPVQSPKVLHFTLGGLICFILCLQV